jgi:hypothetical protein
MRLILRVVDNEYPHHYNLIICEAGCGLKIQKPDGIVENPCAGHKLTFKRKNGLFCK